MAKANSNAVNNWCVGAGASSDLAGEGPFAVDDYFSFADLGIVVDELGGVHV